MGLELNGIWFDVKSLQYQDADEKFIRNISNCVEFSMIHFTKEICLRKDMVV